MSNKLEGLEIFVGGLMFNLLETLWYGRNSEMGFNLKPQSVEELIADYVAIAIMVTGIFIMSLQWRDRK